MITDIHTLGTEYNVTDNSGNILKTLQLIPYEEILDAAIGPYEESHGSYSEYLEKSVSVLSGFETVEYNRVLWFSTLEDEVTAKELIELALTGGYDYVILEKLDDSDLEEL